MGAEVNGMAMNVLGGVTLAVIFAASLGLAVSWFV
jgi:hypothetical protein